MHFNAFVSLTVFLVSLLFSIDERFSLLVSEQSLTFGESKNFSEKKIVISAPHGVLGVLFVRLTPRVLRGALR